MLERSTIWLTFAALALAGASVADEWPNWRGPARNGISSEHGLVSAWSIDGTNLIWRQPFTGRSSPVVFQGRACANGRVGEGIRRQEMVACFDAETGEPLWEHRFNVYQTTVPWTRVGWANVTGDPETGYLYVQGVGGTFLCLDSRDGRVVWERNLIEELGFMEGYGGRTQTPTVDEGRVIVTFSNTSWGSQSRPLHRSFAFDKRTGELLWWSAPGASQADKNAQSTPLIAVIDGRRLVIQGNGGGWIFALEARTGKKVWGFELSKRGINTSVVVDETTVYASHSEENVDEGTMGRVVAIDATGEGDVTTTHERWRAPISAGYSSLIVHDGRVFVVDNSANLHALDAATGEEIWDLNVGTVGKGSPVWADGKIYLLEVNGRVQIVAPGETSGELLATEVITLPNGRPAEIYGSPAVAYGRLYFTTEEGFYSIGDPETPFSAAPGDAIVLDDGTPEADAAPVTLRVMPAEIELESSETASFSVELFDAKGRSLGTESATWSLDGVDGSISEAGVLSPNASAGSQTGEIVATVGDLTATARVRILSGLPLGEDFESTEVGSRPDYFLAYVSRWSVEALDDGRKVLAKGPSPRKIHRHITFLGSAGEHGYTIETDLLGTRTGRRVPDMGVLNSGYTLDLQGAHQKVEIRSWASALRMAQTVDFAWETDVWYRMKMRVDVTDDNAVIRGKVWKRGEEEPDTWTIEAVDPLPIRTGSPGLYGFSPTAIYYDNVTVTRNEG